MKDGNENENHAVYIRCRTCGRYVEENQSINNIYCSETCAGTFTRCPNCGRFFPAINKERHNGFCSTECEAVYNEDGMIIPKETETSQNKNETDAETTSERRTQ